MTTAPCPLCPTVHGAFRSGCLPSLEHYSARRRNICQEVSTRPANRIVWSRISGRPERSIPGEELSHPPSHAVCTSDSPKHASARPEFDADELAEIVPLSNVGASVRTITCHLSIGRQSVDWCPLDEAHRAQLSLLAAETTRGFVPSRKIACLNAQIALGDLRLRGFVDVSNRASGVH